ncbi:hypothetical protein M6D81_08810 [Paenibacillus sp. J5C_2022]|uniref:hypothetical protein n=1 Tax=Paenibacillus sp. J5C2022 TaxID=2977129 RepID=UPI0021D21AC2|nr:hypothetical protein [Paenibacillus sp. J5C2022]MCU6708819.1 hypothetical protein [Paenibacillus sp. J5C2022]
MPLRAGVSKREITTDAGGTRVSDPLFAKALILDDGKTKLVIISMDVIAIGGLGDVSDEFLPRLRHRIETELHIPGCCVLVNASHTHPQGRLLCDDEEQIERTFDAVRTAMQNMIMVKAGSGIGHEDRIVVNRNLTMKNGSHWSIRYAHPGPQDNEVADIGSIDPEIGLIRIDRMDGQPLAVVFNYACHQLIGVPDQGITANYSGFACKVIEENLGNGAMALFLQGAGGDILEVYFKDVNRPRNCEHTGTMLGLSALRAIRTIKTSPAELRVVSERVQLPRRKDIPQVIESRLLQQAEVLESMTTTCLDFKSFLPLYLKYSLNAHYPGDHLYRYWQEERIGSRELTLMDDHNRHNLDRYLTNIHNMEKLIRIQEDISTLTKHVAMNREAGYEDIDTEIMGVKIGECAILTAPAELLVDVGLRLKSVSPYDHTIISAFTNGYYHYAAPVDHYAKGGYEVMECMLSPEWQSIYETKVGEILQKLL